jgi:hypothetical protein
MDGPAPTVPGGRRSICGGDFLMSPPLGLGSEAGSDDGDNHPLCKYLHIFLLIDGGGLNSEEIIYRASSNNSNEPAAADIHRRLIVSARTTAIVAWYLCFRYGQTQKFIWLANY